MRFRPCIDLRNGKVVQIVGSTLSDLSDKETITHFISDKPSAYFADCYRKDNLRGGHIIALGPGNETAALEALAAFPGGMQMGGGINPDNAFKYLDAGASHVIVTSYCINNGYLDRKRLAALSRQVGKKRLVLDLSCRQREGRYYVVSDRWQVFTKIEVNESTLEDLAQYCDEFLVHGVDVEGKQSGIEEDLVVLLGRCSPIAVTYAGGAKRFDDLDRIKELGQNRVDFTIGSALDIFGGHIRYADVVEWQRSQ